MWNSNFVKDSFIGEALLDAGSSMASGKIGRQHPASLDLFDRRHAKCGTVSVVVQFRDTLKF